MNEEALFAAALDKRDPAERRAFLDQACAGDARLRQRLERLLAADERDRGILDRTRHAPPHDEAFRPEPPLAAGQDFAGRFVLRQKLGEGGMGEVWVADQQLPVQRRVAVKVVRPGHGSARALARFDQERQALALMSHPNIARVLDAGLEGGRPFFVMELIEGGPLTRYSDDARLTIRERLELFLPVCEAVQHAHSKGVIHRDLKPSNILVESHDGRPVPRVIDFGLAKPVGPLPGAQNVSTEVGTVVGTLEYMSPEQADLNNLDVDTRSDVYSLGVVLYELLSGTVPHSRQELQSLPFAEMLRVIQEVEPPQPSARLSPSATSPEIAAARRSDPAKLRAQVRGDLDWVVMRCLEKEPARRYETASELAADLRRYLADEPVLAGPPSPGYRLRKFARRHRAALAAAAGFLLLTYAGACGVYFAYRRAVAAEIQARENEVRALEQEEKAKAAARAEVTEKHRAQEAEADTRAFAEFLANHVLAASRPEGVQQGAGVNVTLTEALAKAEPALERVFKGRPRAEALARHEIGVTWRNLGRHAEAIRHLERALALRRQALGEDHPDTLHSMNSLGAAYRAAGDLRRAIPLYERALKTQEATLGESDPHTLATLNNLAVAYMENGKPEMAIPLHLRALKAQEGALGDRNPHTLASRNNLASAYRAAGKLQLAIPHFERTLKDREATLPQDHPDTLRSRNNLAAAYEDAGKPGLAIPLYQRTLKAREAILGESHPDTIRTRNNLAAAYRVTGQLPLALPLYERTLQAQAASLGDDHPDTLKSRNNLAVAYWKNRQLDRSVPLFEDVLRRRRAKSGDQDPDTLTVAFNLGVNYRDADRLKEAAALFDEWLPRAAAVLKPGQPQLVNGRRAAASTYLRVGRYDQAATLWAEDVAELRKRVKPDGPQLAGSLAYLGSALLKAGKPGVAEPVLRECLAHFQKHQPEAWGTFNAQALLAAALHGQKKYADAEPLLVQGYQGMKKWEQDSRNKQHGSAARQRLAEVVERLVRLYDDWGRPEEAARWRKEREALRDAAKRAGRP